MGDFDAMFFLACLSFLGSSFIVAMWMRSVPLPSLLSVPYTPPISTLLLILWLQSS